MRHKAARACAAAAAAVAALGVSATDANATANLAASASGHATRLSRVAGMVAAADGDFWLLQLAFILVGYASVLLPGYLLVRVVQRKWKENGLRWRQNRFFEFLRMFAVGQPEYELVASDYTAASAHAMAATPQRLIERATLLLGYAAGIQVTLISMGFFQERIMTREYARVDAPERSERFHDSQFLVFANRLIALLIVGTYVAFTWRKLPPHVPPLYTHSFISISNTISSWCQYEALRHVSFPTQTVFKAAKVVPTMLMGRVLRGERRPASDYAMGVCLATGAAIFLLSAHVGRGAAAAAAAVQPASFELGAAASGVLLMSGYLFFDAFTLNWQKKLFDTNPKISRYQMMLGVNSFSAILCMVSLVEQGTLLSSIGFLADHSDIMRDIFLLSASSALGQLCIYVTIERFGPVVFAIIMTVRQIASIVLSSVYFGHAINALGALGLTLAFGALLVDSYVKVRRTRARQAPKKPLP